jgi:aminoglycoside 6'-N-acetyltransferase I
MPLTILVAQLESSELGGFVEVGLRSCAEGCDPSRPAGYVEGWYVAEPRRRQGIGAALLAAAEGWARQQNCREMASDAQLHNKISQQVHLALGFEEVERSVNYGKAL